MRSITCPSRHAIMCFGAALCATAAASAEARSGLRLRADEAESSAAAASWNTAFTLDRQTIDWLPAAFSDDAVQVEDDDERAEWTDANDRGAVGRTFIRLGAGGSHMFRTSMDEGGNVSRSVVTGGFSARHIATERLTVSATVGYEWEQYRFRNPVAFAGRSWGDIHHLTFSGGMRLKMTDEWSILAGSSLRFGAEDGASWDDAITGSGTIGAVFRVRDGLVLGAGFGVHSRLERSTLVFPIVVLDWTFAENWRLVTDSGAFFIEPGLEVIHTLSPQWTLGAGVSFVSRGFRLSDSGDVPDGVGTFDGIPLHLRATWNASERAQFTVQVGAVFAGEIELRDEAGNPLGKEDLSTGLMLAGSFQIRF